MIEDRVFDQDAIRQSEVEPRDIGFAGACNVVDIAVAHGDAVAARDGERVIVDLDVIDDHIGGFIDAQAPREM